MNQDLPSYISNESNQNDNNNDDNGDNSSEMVMIIIVVINLTVQIHQMKRVVLLAVFTLVTIL